MALVATWLERAIAEAWDSGRIASPAGPHPFQGEVAALVGHSGHGGAADAVASAVARGLVAAEAVREALPPGEVTPLGAFGKALGLSPLAQRILLVAVAPLAHGELARLYGILANDGARPLVDELLVYEVLAGIGANRYDIARELDENSPLVRTGLLGGDARLRPFAELTVDPLVFRRLRGEGTAPAPGEPSVAVAAERSLDELAVEPGAIAALLDNVDRAQPGPLRIVARGHVGSGRRTLLAALARRAGRELGTIDVRLLPMEPTAFLGALALELRRSTIRGWLPCLVGVEDLADERTSRERLRDVVRVHPGPLAVRLDPHTAAPFDPGYIEVTLRPLDQARRQAFLEEKLVSLGVGQVDTARLVTRYRVGPGVLARAAAAAAPSGGESEIETAIRQHLDGRLRSVATRIDVVPPLERVILPADVMDSILELLGRVRHRHLVFERWGLAGTTSTPRGLTALFSGGPGTGKTMVAGAIARELGLDLYRVDLARITSKWIGETEKNLSSVFDAAEDGQAIILFDEADSLFARRTDVKSSVDRYSNLETNYLLQRLDSFDGIAILTTNFSSSIDAAFKRRLSFRILFPFPNEMDRERLWRAHLPDTLPVAGPLDLAGLARRYQLSGGYIRNAVLRAAFLAAEDQRALCQRHLERAVELEYNDVGKLAHSGVLE